VRAEPRGGDIEAREFAIFVPLEERGPAVDRALVEAVGAPEVVQPLGLPVDRREQGYAFRQLVAETSARLDLGANGAGQPSRPMGDQPSTYPMR
jgi:hypothetical protein